MPEVMHQRTYLLVFRDPAKARHNPDIGYTKFGDLSCAKTLWAALGDLRLRMGVKGPLRWIGVNTTARESKSGVEEELS